MFYPPIEQSYLFHFILGEHVLLRRLPVNYSLMTERIILSVSFYKFSSVNEQLVSAVYIKCQKVKLPGSVYAGDFSDLVNDNIALLKAQTCIISFQTCTQIFGSHKALIHVKRKNCVSSLSCIVSMCTSTF